MNDASKDRELLGQQTHRAYCPICTVWCGIDVTTDGNKIIKVVADKTSPRDWQEFCSKEGNAGKTRDHAKRLKTPMKRVGDKHVPAVYEGAIKNIAAKRSKIRKECGSHAIATYLGNPGGCSMMSNMFQERAGAHLCQ